jgi:PAS domain S-box-containing protein
MSNKKIGPEVRCINLYKHLPNPTYVWKNQKDEMVLADYNQAALEFSGPTLNQFINRKAKTIYADFPKVIEWMNQCQRHKQTITEELTLPHRATGEPRFLKSSWIWIDPDIILFIIQDLTEIKVAKQRLEQLVEKRTTELKTANTELKRSLELFDQGPVIVIIWEPTGCQPIRYISENVQEVLGYSSKEIKSRSLIYKSLIHPDDADRINEEADQFIDRGMNSYEQYYRLKKKDGEYIWIYDSTVIERDKQGKPQLRRGYLLDQTNLKNAEIELQKSHLTLEQKVQKRTAQLAKANMLMQQEIKSRKKSQESLLASEITLEKERASLLEANITLKVLMREVERERKAFEENVSTNLLELVDPYLKKLEKSKLDDRQRNYLEIIKTHLENIVSPFVRTSVAMDLKLTPAEIQIANLIRSGQSSKQIAEALTLSPLTIDKHRGNIRKKLGITNQRTNLKTLLRSREKPLSSKES